MKPENDLKLVPELENWIDAGEILDPVLAKIVREGIGEGGALDDAIYLPEPIDDEETEALVRALDLAGAEAALRVFQGLAPDEESERRTGAVEHLSESFECGFVRSGSLLYRFERSRVLPRIWDGLRDGDVVSFVADDAAGEAKRLRLAGA